MTVLEFEGSGENWHLHLNGDWSPAAMAHDTLVCDWSRDSPVALIRYEDSRNGRTRVAAHNAAWCAAPPTWPERMPSSLLASMASPNKRPCA